MNTYWTEAAQLYLILHQSCFSLKSDHQDLLRSFTFTVPQRRNDLLRSLYYSSLNQHCIICYNLILLRHITGDIERRLIFRSFYVISYKDLIDLHYKHQKKYLLQIHIFAHFESDFFFLHFLTISDYMSHKSLMDQI